MTTSTPIGAADMPAGEYAIVEMLGHRIFVGRIEEVTRFGVNMLQIEPLFAEEMLAPVLISGASIYQLTPCSPDIAYARRPKRTSSLPPTVAAVVPARALPTSEEMPSFLDEAGEDGEDLPF